MPRLSLLLCWLLTALITTSLTANAQRPILGLRPPTSNACGQHSTPDTRHPTPGFNHDIVPILKAACIGCHGDRNPSAQLSLTSYAALMKGGAKGVDVVAGDDKKSRLYGYLTGTITPKMPLGSALKPEQIELFRRWIDAGAKDDLPDSKHPTAGVRPSMPMISAPMPVTALAFSPDGKTLVVGLYREVQFRDASSGRLTGVWSGHAGAVHALAFSKDGKRLAAGGGDPGLAGEVRIWDVTTAHETSVLGEHTDVVNAVAFSPDSKRLASGSMDKTVRVWDVTNGKTLAVLADHADAVTGVAYSPDGKYLASCSADKSIKVWDTTNNKRLYTIDAHDDAVTGVAFSPDGKLLLSASADRSARIWNFGKDGSGLTASLTGHGQAVLAACFSPDGKTIATASADRSVRLWSIGGGAISTLKAAKDWIYSVCFSPDGKQVAAGTWDGEALLWTAPDGKTLTRWTTLTPQNLSRK